MAKTIRTNKKKGIKAKSQKDNKFAKLKLLSKYIVSGGNQRMFDKLMETDKQQLRNMKYRSIAQLVQYPKLISYINTYMNSKFDFGSMPPETWFYSIMLMCKLFGINNTNQLYYSKFQQVERDNFIKTLNSYYNEIGDGMLNNNEMNALFTLYKFGIIQEDILTRMKEVVTGKSQAAGKNKVVQNQNQFSIQSQNMAPVATDGAIQLRTFESLSSDVQGLVSNISGYVAARNVCKQCELNQRHAVSIDTNVTHIQEVDLLFMGFQPSNKDSANRLPFSDGDSSKLFHRFLQPLVERYNLKYVLTNYIFCPIDKTKQLQNKRKTIRNCAQLLDEVVRQFKPKLKVVIGLDAIKTAGLKGGITKLNGKLIDNIFVLMDPEAVIINNNKLKQYETGWIQLEQYIQENQSAMTTTVSIDEFNIPQHQIISTITNDLTMFDMKVIKDKIVKIMLDKNGVKKYLIEPIQVPVYVKKGTYSDCINFSDTMDGVIYCSEQERQTLNSKLYREINKCEGL